MGDGSIINRNEPADIPHYGEAMNTSPTRRGSGRGPAIIIEIDGARYTIAALARHAQVTPAAVYARWRKGVRGADLLAKGGGRGPASGSAASPRLAVPAATPLSVPRDILAQAAACGIDAVRVEARIAAGWPQHRWFDPIRPRVPVRRVRRW
jgi:hypothetical protein